MQIATQGHRDGTACADGETEERIHHQDRIMSPEATKSMGIWTAIGIAIGVGIGAMMENVAVGIAIGAGLGAAIGTYMVERDGSKDDSTDRAHR